MNTQAVVQQANQFIREGNLFSLQEYYESLKIPSENEIEIYGEKIAPPIKRLDLAYIFSKTFTNACLYNRYHIVVWLMEMYEELDDFAKLGVKSTFNYARHMTKIKKFYKIHSYLVSYSKKHIAIKANKIE